MYKKIPGGSVIDVQGLKCNLPPVGMVVNTLTNKLEPRDIITRSTRKAEQFWERTPLPVWWKKREQSEELQQRLNPDYTDPEMNAIINQEWDRRLNGVWFMNNGEPVYLTGLHYFYLQWWMIDIGYPKYRLPDLEYFYFLQYCIDDPECFGSVELTKRRFGKTYRAGLFLFEYVSRSTNANAGAQSKTGVDAKRLFQKAIIYPFKKLPKFFRPQYDQSQGITPKSELSFMQTTIKGKRSLEVLDKEELGSMVNYGTSEKAFYDGSKLHRYIADETGKTVEVNIWDRHQIVKWCVLDDDGKIIGKLGYMTTCEDMESGGGNFKIMWDNSDQLNKDGNKRTPSGLYRFFMPAYKTRCIDKYGIPDEIKARTLILEERKSLERDPRALSAAIRKEAMSVEEAFWIDSDKCHYNAFILKERYQLLLWNEFFVTGDLIWENGERDTKVKFVPNQAGHFQLCKELADEDANQVVNRGNILYPDNTLKFIGGADPYDMDTTVDDRRSDGCAVFKRKYDALDELDPYNDAFYLRYRYRPKTADIFYEDVIKMCHYLGAEILVESNKFGLIKYFIKRGYSKFLIWLPGYPNAGVPSSIPMKEQMVEYTEAYIERAINKVYFPSMIKDWLEFDITKTLKFDEAMACGYCLLADKYKEGKKKKDKLPALTDYFTMTKVI